MIVHSRNKSNISLRIPYFHKHSIYYEDKNKNGVIHALQTADISAKVEIYALLKLNQTK